jgi:hypothetical protein
MTKIGQHKKKVTNLTKNVFPIQYKYTYQYLRIWAQISRICVFLGLPDPDPLVKGTGSDPSTASSIKNSKKILDSYCFVIS